MRNLAAVMNWNDTLSTELEMVGSSRMNLNAASKVGEYISETVRDWSIGFSRRSRAVAAADFVV